jgi:magnesium transporter
MELSVSFANQPHIHIHPPSPERDELREDEGDIYRGEPPAEATSQRPGSAASSRLYSSSSSISLAAGGGLGALAAVVERAISRWARANWSASSLSLSSSSSSSRSSFRTANKSTRRKRRRSSLADTRIAESEREVAARIRAREERRHVPREFCLYLPPAAASQESRAATNKSEPQTTQTSLLPPIINQLEGILKTSSRFRRTRHRPRGRKLQSESRAIPPESPTHISPVPNKSNAIPRSASTPDLTTLYNTDKGRRRGFSPVRPQKRVPLVDAAPPAWWLDIASPTWEDMRAIGKVCYFVMVCWAMLLIRLKLLHIHPLTLEDILQQEPREKLELFPKLGYYFVVFRAIESHKIWLNAGRDQARDPYISKNEEGLVSEVYVYLVVFKDGICSVSVYVHGREYIAKRL